MDSQQTAQQTGAGSLPAYLRDDFSEMAEATIRRFAAYARPQTTSHDQTEK